MTTEKISAGYQQYANYLAKKAGFNRATKILQDAGQPVGVVESQSYGYRKWTTGEYVPNKYRANFGWKNTYYQHAVCIVNIGV
jgi:hypothetical protein